MSMNPDNAFLRFIKSEAQLGKERTMTALGAAATVGFFGLGMAYRSVELPTKMAIAVPVIGFQIAVGAAGLALAVPEIMKRVLDHYNESRKGQLRDLAEKMLDTKKSDLIQAITSSPALSTEQKGALINSLEKATIALAERQKPRVERSGIFSAAVNEAIVRTQTFLFGRSQSRIQAGVKALNAFDEKYGKRDTEMSTKCKEFSADLVNKAADGHFSLVESLQFRAKLAVRSAFESVSSFMRKLAPNPFPTTK